VLPFSVQHTKTGDLIGHNPVKDVMEDTELFSESGFSSQYFKFSEVSWVSFIRKKQNNLKITWKFHPYQMIRK
jgi:hypothetical protein